MITPCSPEKLAMELFPFPSNKNYEVRLTIEKRAAFVEGFKTADSYYQRQETKKYNNDKIKVAAYKTVLEYYDFSTGALHSKRRFTPIIEGRRVFYCLLRKYSSYSLMEIGAFFSQDHATVLNALRKNENLCFSDKSYREKFDKIEGIFNYNLNN